MVRCSTDGGLRAAHPTDGMIVRTSGASGTPPPTQVFRNFRRGDPRGRPQAGKSAPPVADEASRFRGSAPIGGHDSARESVGTTVGKRTPPLRTTNNASVGADAYIGPPYALLVMCHCEASAHTGCGNPFSSSLVQGYYGCPCCGAQNFCAALRRTLEILTATTRSLRSLCHRQRSARSPRPVCGLVSE